MKDTDTERFATLHTDIAQDTFDQLVKGTLDTKQDVLRYLAESVDSSEVSFKSHAAKLFLAQHGITLKGGDTAAANEKLYELVLEEFNKKIETLIMIY